MKRLLLAWTLGASLCLSIEASANGDAVAECERWAAVPFYPDVRVNGKEFTDIDAAGARSACEHAVDENPSSGYLWYLLTRVYTAAGEREFALQAASRAIELQFEGSSYLRSLSAYSDGDIAEAQRFLREAGMAGFYPAAYELAEILALEGDLDAAVALASPLLEIGYPPAQTLIALIEADQSEQFPAQRVQALLTAAAESGYLRAMKFLADFYSGTGAFDGIDHPYLNTEKSKHYLVKAAKAGEPISQHYLALQILDKELFSELNEDPVWLLEEASRKGYAPAKVDLALMYFNGTHAEVDVNKGLALLESAAAADNALANNFLGQIFLNGLLEPSVQRDIEAALNYLTRAADLGDLEAMASLGAVLVTGDNYSDQRERGLNLLTRAAEQGVVLAQVALGEMYFLGSDGIAQDDEEAWRWLSLAQSQGSGLASLYLGDMILEGRHTSSDAVQAFGNYLDAAEKGITDAFYAVGTLLWEGVGTRKDEYLAIEWLKKGVEQNSAMAAGALADCLFKGGSTIKPDPVAALQYYAIAADLGDPFSQSKLGNIYREGVIVPRNESEAIRYLTLAAEAGHAFAIHDLGSLLLNADQQDLRDPDRAVMWLYEGTRSEIDGVRKLSNSLLAEVFAEGNGVERDIEKAISHYIAADQATLAAGLLTYGEPEERDTSRAIQILKECHEAPQDQWCANYLGILLNDNTSPEYDPSSALKWFSAGAERGNVDSLVNLSKLYLLGNGTPMDIGLAFQYLDRAAEMNKDPSAIKVAEADLALASAYAHLIAGDLETAERLFQNGLMKSADTEDPEFAVFTVDALGQLGMLYAQQARFKSALNVASTLAKQEFSDAETAEFASRFSTLISVIAYLGLGEKERVKAIVSSHPIFNGTGFGFGDTALGIALEKYMRGSIYFALEQYDEAVANFDDARPVLERVWGKTSYNAIALLGASGFALAELGEINNGRRLLKTAIERAEESGMGGLTYLQAKSAYAYLLYRSGKTREARQIAAAAAEQLLEQLGEPKKGFSLATYTERRSAKHVFETYLLLQVNEDNIYDRVIVEETFRIAQQANWMTVEEGIADWVTRDSVPSLEAKALVEQLAKKRDDVRAIDRGFQQSFFASTAQRNAMSAAAEGLNEEIELLSRQLAERGINTQALLGRPEVSVGSLQSVLRDDEVVLLFFIGRRFSFGWSVSRDSAAVYRIPVTQAALQEMISRLRENIDSRMSFAHEYPRDVAYQLFELLLSRGLKGHDYAERVIIVPDVYMMDTPFLALRMTKSVEADDRGVDMGWLGTRYAFSLAPSALSLLTLRSRVTLSAAKLSFLGVGNPRFGNLEYGDRSVKQYSDYFDVRGLGDREELSQLSELPESEQELRTLATLLDKDNSRLLLREFATEEQVKSLDLSQYRVVAFATHGLVAGQVSGIGEPALALSLPKESTRDDDGLLTASEIAQLRLDADIVVLSACDTGAGGADADAAGLSGLARSFFAAGSRNVLVSSWPVVSLAAQSLTTNMFLSVGDSTPPDFPMALKKSIIAVLQNASSDFERHPAFWAPFIVVGQ